MDVAASEFYGSDKTYDLNFKEEVSFCYMITLAMQVLVVGMSHLFGLAVMICCRICIIIWSWSPIIVGWVYALLKPIL